MNATCRPQSWAAALAATLLSCALGAAAEPEAPAAAPRTAADAEIAADDAAGESADPFEPRYLIESIEVRGNERTSTQLILSYLDFEAGDLLEQELVELARFRLLALGYFKDVRTRLERGSERGQVRLVVQVDERWTYLIVDDLFLGWTETNPFWGGFGVSDINFLGQGMVLSLAWVASDDQGGGRLGLFWPSILGSSYSAGVTAFGLKGREHALAGRISPPAAGVVGCDFDQDRILDYWRAGALVNFGLRLGRRSRLAFEIRGEHIHADVDERIAADGAKCRNDPFLDYVRNGDSTLVSLRAQFERDSRDDFFLPTKGMHLIISVELASKVLLGSDYEYSKYMLQYEHSFNFYLDHVWRITLVGGLLQDVGSRGSPFFERFFIGDYARFQIDKTSLPRNLELNFSNATDYGDLLGSVELEYDVPLWTGGSFFYRGYVFAALNFSVVTKASFLASDQEWSGRTKRPLTFDLGLKLETPIGLLTFSAGYLTDLIVD